MERLTFEGNFCDIAQCESVPGGSYCENGSCTQREIWERLKAYEDTGLTPESVEGLKLSMMGKAISEITEFDGLPIERLKELARADREGRVRIMPEGTTGTCGSCENFERLPGEKSGTCKVHHYCKNRYGKIDERRGRFRPAQSHKSCKQYKPRGSGGSAKEG